MCAPEDSSQPIATVVIPAHNEEQTIGRLLDALTSATGDAGPHVIVVPNGCTDKTVDLVTCRRDVEVLVLDEGSKQKAMRAGAERTRHFPIAYVDADVELTGQSLGSLVAALDDASLLAVAPRRVLDVSRSSWIVRSYLSVWQDLPQVREGLFGRGVIVLSQVGQRRIESLPMYLSDDLALSETFDRVERRIVDQAVVTVHAPRTVSDLLRRRQRIVMGTQEFDAQSTNTRERTGLGSLLGVTRRRPGLVVHLPTFVLVTLASRAQLAIRLKRRQQVGWLRDDSSRGD